MAYSAGNNNDDVQRVKERLDIVEVIGDRVKLQRNGRNYIGLCPFHNEKTPSFNVSQERQSYHCFGCGRGGDVFSFVMEAEGLDFRSCLELLAARAGVELARRGRENAGRSTSIRNLYEVMSLAQNFFAEKLRAPEGAAGRGYMQRRNLTLKDAEKFGLGWSLTSWDGLLRYLRANDVPDKLAFDAGLILQGQRGGFYDRFRGRLMFPIKDITGRVIAFGGRLVDGEGAKYINSPEGDIYSKRRNLYLLHEARNSIRERKRCILVEGYMDALRLHLNGFTETVASLGTSLTEEQSRLLQRFSDQCYICYDSDTAGQDATLRGMYILANPSGSASRSANLSTKKEGLDVYVITLPSGKDPDELLTSSDIDGRKLFVNAVANARPLVLQHLHAVRAQLEAPETRRSASENLMSGLVQLDRAAITPYLSELAGALGLYPETFWQELDVRRARRDLSQKRQQSAQSAWSVRQNQGELMPSNPQKSKPFDPLEAALCALLWQDNNRDNCRRDQQSRLSIMSLLNDERTQQIALAIMMESQETLQTRWLSLGERLPLALIARGNVFCDEITSMTLNPDDNTPESTKWAFLKNNLSFSVKNADPWKVVCSALRQRKNFVRQKELKDKMLHNTATPEEVAEFAKLTASLPYSLRLSAEHNQI